MKLYTKLTLFTAIATIAVLGLFVLFLPKIMESIAEQNTDKTLLQQRNKVLTAVKENGIGYYVQADSGYGSYSMLKDEYISLEQYSVGDELTKLQTAHRVVDNDTINYRILIDTFTAEKKIYLLEIGKKTASIHDDSIALQRATFKILIALALLIALIQLFYTRHILKPLNSIIQTRLIKRVFPFKEPSRPLKTNTYDFKYLDQSISDLTQQINAAFEKEKEFTSNASHELMTPISIMQSKLENMLMDPGLSDDALLRLEDTMRIMKRLKKIVNSLLLISRIENDQYDFTDHVQIKKMVREVLEELQHRADEKDLIINEGLSNTAVLNNVNKDLLFQLFYNLIHNAIKFSKNRGTITINDQLLEDAYCISITDTGVGMDAKQQEKVFHRFKKGLYQKEGFGLGLSIVKSIADYLKIKIDVVSSTGKGTTFRLSFLAKHLKK